MLLWGLGAAAAIVVPARRASAAPGQIDAAFRISASMAERFGLFTIIVLGEVMAGVVNGLAGAEHSTATTVVGLLCLGIGFGIWWNYFDFVGLRRPRPGLGVRGIWLVTHLPLSMAVAATGAGMVSLIEHAADSRSPAGTAWLVGGAMALLCLCLAQLLRVLPERPGARLVPAGLLGAAVLSRRRGRAAPASVGPDARAPARAHRRVDRVLRPARPTGRAVRRLRARRELNGLPAPPAATGGAGRARVRHEGFGLEGVELLLGDGTRVEQLLGRRDLFGR